jgi:hypothetical protein
VQEEAGKMTVDDLVRFNRISANAFAQFEAENDLEVSGYWQIPRDLRVTNPRAFWTILAILAALDYPNFPITCAF